MAHRNLLQDNVAKLRKEGVRSSYLERIRARLRHPRAIAPDPNTATSAEPQQHLAQEDRSSITDEILQHSESKVDLALVELELAEQRLETARISGAPPEHVECLRQRFNHDRAAALSARRGLEVQQQAMGIEEHQAITRDFPVPPRR